MINPKRLPDTWQEALKIINRCPICSVNYTADAAKLFARQDNATLIHFTCADCKSYFVAMIVQMGHGVSSVGMVTDLSHADVERLYKKDVLTVDDTIAYYQELQQESFVKTLK